MNRAADALEQFLSPRTRWAMVTVGICMTYFVARLIPWVASGCKIAGLVWR